MTTPQENFANAEKSGVVDAFKRGEVIQSKDLETPKTTPLPGEYWYLNVRKETIDTWTGEIFSNQCVELGKYIGHDLFQINDQIISKRQYILIGKWEPNRFWKFLGYK